MSKQQLIVVVIAIACALLLFTLPKVLLNKEEKELVNSTEIEKMEAPQKEAVHTGPVARLDEMQANAVLKFRTALKQSKTIREKLPLLDSISRLFNAKSLYDSTAYYYEKNLAEYKNADGWIAIGDACYQAYYFAVDEAVAQSWAKKTQLNYQKALDQDPGLLDVKARLAMTYTRSSNPMQAIATLREVLDKDPENEQALLNIGLLSIQSGQHAKAVERFTKLININPKNWLGVFYLGIAYAESGKKTEAKECFEKVKKYEKQPQLVQAAEEYLKQLSTH